MTFVNQAHKIYQFHDYLSEKQIRLLKYPICFIDFRSKIKFIVKLPKINK